MKAILDHVEPLTAHIKTFWFKPERHLHFVAGEFTELYLPHANPDERGEKHWFTISSSPTDPLLSITTKFPAADQRTSTFKQTLSTLPVGSEVHLAEPMGDFVLPKLQSIPILYIAGGIGVTPIHSMVRYLHDTQEQRDITLLYTVNSPDELIFTDTFQSYPMHFVPIVKSPDAQWHGETGMLTSERVMTHLQPDMLVYLSGPEPMIKALTDDLKKQGVDKRNTVTDFFPGYSQF
jgi:ferredoxin-NADP reductase